jgi:CSLREA domain-containing protein
VIISAGANDAVDPGETVTVVLGLQHSGAVGECAPAPITGTLQPTAGLTSAITPPQNYGSVCAGAAPVWRVFSFTLSPGLSCGTAAPITLALALGSSKYGTVNYTLPTSPFCSSAFTVTTTDDHDDAACTPADCTLREAINSANRTSASAIGFAPGLSGTIQLKAALAPLNTTVAIDGPGANLLSIRRSTGGSYRVFLLNPGAVARVAGLTVENGAAIGANGGGIYNGGLLTLSDCVLTGNSAAGTSFALVGHGGGIYNASAAILNLTRCTLSANTATLFGGGVYNDGILAANNCTFSGNVAGRGGGVMSRYSNGLASASLRNCTISNCTATSTSSGKDGGGGYFAEGLPQQHHLANTIIAGNSNAMNPDVMGQFTSEGHNLISRVGRAVGFSHGLNGDQIGSAAAPVDPLLAPLGTNGGSVPTHALLTGSAAADAGNDFLAAPIDARRFPRVGVSDIGAFELHATNAAPAGPALVSVVSRKTHGSAGVFDLPLPLVGSAGVESRSGGTSGSHTLILTFATPLARVGGVALVSSSGTVARGSVGSEANQYVVELTGVANGQDVTVSVANITDVLGGALGNVSVTMGVLLGDSNGDRTVNSGDAQQTRNRSGQTTSAANFRSDYNLDGTINSGDATLVRSRSGQSIP